MSTATRRVHDAPFQAEALRAQFPALQRAGSFVFLDNAAGAQVPQAVLDAVNRHLVDHNVQRGGRYARSVAVDATIQRAFPDAGDYLQAAVEDREGLGVPRKRQVTVSSHA